MKLITTRPDWRTCERIQKELERGLNAMTNTREIEGWYPNQQAPDARYLILTFELDGHRVLPDGFYIDGQESEQDGPEFNYMLEEAFKHALEPDFYE